MAVTTWDGSSSTDWNTAANWDTGAVPTSADDVIIPDDSTTANDCTLSATGGNPKNVKSLKIEANGTIVGGGIQIRVFGESAAGFAVDNDGIISGSLFLEIKTPSATKLDLMGSSGNFNSVIINHASCDAFLEANTAIDGNLTITLGKLTCTTEAGDARTLTVAGKTTIGDSGHSSVDQATLTATSQDLVLGSGKTDDYAILIEKGGTFVGGSGAHTSGAIRCSRAEGKFTFTSGTHNINSENTSANRFFELTLGELNNSNGTILLNASASSEIQWDDASTTGDTGPHNLTINHASNVTRSRIALIIEGDLTLTAGEYNTRSNDGGADKNLTVTGNVIIAASGTLTCNTSTVSVNSITISANGTLDAPDSSGSLTLNGTLSAWSFQNNSTNFNHNNGTVTQTAAGHIKSVSSNPFYNFILNSSSSDSHEAVFRPKTGTDCVIAANDVTVTRGIVKLNTVSNTASMAALTIGSTGTFQASSTTTTVSGDMASNGTLTHNNGKFVFNEHLEISGTSLTFYNVSAESGVVKTVDYMNDTTIENELDGNNQWRLKASSNTVTLTMGTATSQGTIDTTGMSSYGLEWDSNTSNFVKIKGVNSLFPAIITGTNIDWDDVSSGLVRLENCDFQGDITTGGGGVTITLTGDCEFDAVTLSSGDALDLNGQRAEFGGNVTYSGSLDADGLMVFHGGFTKYGTLTNAASADIMTMSTSGTPTFSFISDYRTFFQNGGVQLGTGGFTGVTNAIVAGTTNVGTRNTSATNLTIPTGGIFQAEAKTHTVSGDFTTSGGLIGKSALDFDGTSTCRVADHSDFDGLTNATWMGWYKLDDVSADRNFMGQNSSFSLQVFENSTNKTRFSLFDGTSFTDLEGNTTITVDNKWHHIAFVMDGSNNKMYTYIDGKLDAEGAWTGTLNGSSADIFIGGYAAHNVKGFAGLLGNASFWNVALTSTQIRAKMFSDFTGLDSNTGCKGWWQFDEGTGGNGDTTASSVGSHPATLGPAGNAPNWAGAGTFTKGTSTLKMTGANKFINHKDSLSLNSLTIATLNDANATILKDINGGNSTTLINGNLEVQSGKLTSNTSELLQIGKTYGDFYIASGKGGTALAEVHGLYIFQNGQSGTKDFPHASSSDKDLTLKRIFINSTSTFEVVSQGNLTTTEELEVGGGNTFNTNGKTITSKLVDVNEGTFAVGSGTLVLSHPGSGFDSVSNTVLTAGPGATISGSSAATTFKSQNNFVVVGKVENLNVTNEELSVTGQVINCTGEIHQQFPTIDHDQQLDFDTADDRDIILGRDLDKNTELINS